MKRLTVIVLLSSLIIGCDSNSSSGRDRESKVHSILDDAAARTDLNEEWALADRALPSDVWSVQPKVGKINATRLKRQMVLTEKLLDGIRPKIERMSALELLNSLKLEGALTSSGRDSIIVFYVWCYGNELMIEELKRRPKGDLEALRNYADDSRVIVTEGSGQYLEVGFVVRQVLGDTP